MLAKLAEVRLSSFAASYRVSSLSATLWAEHSRTREVGAAYSIKYSIIVCERYLEALTDTPENGSMLV